MNIYRVRIRKDILETHLEYMAAPSLKVAKDNAWIKFAKKISEEFLTEPTYEGEKVKIAGVLKIENLKEIPSKWFDSLPWYHPAHPVLDEDLTIKEYFECKNIKNALNFSIEKEIRDLEYRIKRDSDDIEELKKQIIK